MWIDAGGIDQYGIIWPLICIDKPPKEWVDYVTGKRIAREHYGRFKEFVEVPTTDMIIEEGCRLSNQTVVDMKDQLIEKLTTALNEHGTNLRESEGSDGWGSGYYNGLERAIEIARTLR